MNKKYIIDTIKKMAQNMPEEYGKPATVIPTARPQATPGNKIIAPGKYKDPGIKKMQEALIGLAQDVTSEINIPQNKHTTKYSPNMEATINEPRDPEIQEATGRDS